MRISRAAEELAKHRAHESGIEQLCNRFNNLYVSMADNKSVGPHPLRSVATDEISTGKNMTGCQLLSKDEVAKLQQADPEIFTGELEEPTEEARPGLYVDIAMSIDEARIEVATQIANICLSNGYLVAEYTEAPPKRYYERVGNSDIPSFIFVPWEEATEFSGVYVPGGEEILQFSNLAERLDSINAALDIVEQTPTGFPPLDGQEL